MDREQRESYIHCKGLATDDGNLLLPTVNAIVSAGTYNLAQYALNSTHPRHRSNQPPPTVRTDHQRPRSASRGRSRDRGSRQSGSRTPTPTASQRGGSRTGRPRSRSGRRNGQPAGPSTAASAAPSKTTVAPRAEVLGTYADASEQQHCVPPTQGDWTGSYIHQRVCHARLTEHQLRV